jgi:hypothetical protein
MAQDVEPCFENVSNVEEKSLSVSSDMFETISEDSITNQFNKMTIKPIVLNNTHDGQMNCKAAPPPPNIPNLSFLEFG